MDYITITSYPEKPGQGIRLDLNGNKKNTLLSLDIKEQPCLSDGRHMQIVIKMNKRLPKKSVVRLIKTEADWEINNYVFAPSALYNGNRFESLEKPYPPMLNKEESEFLKGKTVLSDVPRLRLDGNGGVQLGVGDLSVPCVGFFSVKQQSGFLLFFKQENELENFGVAIQENAETNTAEFILSAPCVRTPHKYGMCTTKENSNDKGAKLKKGDVITFDFTEYRFPCGSITEFLKRFWNFREKQNFPRRHPQSVPWQYAFHLIEDKYNRRNWVEDLGFYASSEAASGICRQWQTGWVGGGINTWPALAIGNDESKEKSRRTLEFLFTKVQHKSGFLYGIFCDGRPYGDNTDAENTDIVLIRKNADALYYLAKQLLYMRINKKDIKPLWHDGLFRLANAFVRFFEANGEIGQFIDMQTEKPFTYGSASGGLASAGLTLCSVYFENPIYLKTAKQIAKKYYAEYIAKGYSTGGPGEILSCPDSESAFALLESYVVLYRATQNQQWLRFAEDTAALCASWCVGYDYHWKNDTQFAERRICATGAVWANVQNKHAAPGICTMSGESLLHLYRATGNIAFLNLLKDIAHNLTQYISTPERPMYTSYVWHNKPARLQKRINRAMAKSVFILSEKHPFFKKVLAPTSKKIFNPSGRINERVNLSDWEGSNNVGEVPLGSCWCEVSAMLTFLEIPAVYIQPDTAFCFTLDHIECTVKSKTEKSITVELHNSTQYDAEYHIFIESKMALSPFPIEETLPFQTIFLHSGERLKIEIPRSSEDA